MSIYIDLIQNPPELDIKKDISIDSVNVGGGSDALIEIKKEIKK